MASRYVHLSDSHPYVPPTLTDDAPSYDDHAPLVQKPTTQQSSFPPDRPIRTPSPTPSEAEELAEINGTVTKTFVQKLRDRLGLHRRFIVRWIVILILITLLVLLSVYEGKIIVWLQPAVQTMYKLPAGWLIPVAILILLSFPPLLGQEIIITIVGLTWGLGEGFGIVAAGTLLGELLSYFVFRYVCIGWARKMQEKNLMYGCLAKVVRDGGIWIPVLVRYSSIPNTYATAIFATCGMPLWVMVISIVAALPNQLAQVFFGVAIESTIKGDVKEAKMESIVNDILIVVQIIATIVAQHVLVTKMKSVKPAVIYERRKARQTKMLESAYSDDFAPGHKYDPSASSLSFNEAAV